MLTFRAEAYNNETFTCARCKNDFQATIATWVDVSRAPLVKLLLQEWTFNVVTCPRCGNRQFSDSFFFYEDFAEGLLVAVFPDVPTNRVSLEEEIRRLYGHYPVLEFFYDISQLWLLIYLQRHYKDNENPLMASKIGTGEERLRRFLSFLKTNPLMLRLRETLTATFLGNKTNEDLQDILWRALSTIEGESPWSPEAAARADAGPNAAMSPHSSGH
jgi:hypothetical protein